MAQRADFNWSGRSSFDDAHREARKGAVRGLLIAGEHLLGEARDLVPLEEGTLERSGEVIVDPDKLTVAVVFDTPYAIRQHEEMAYRHAPGRQAKYLEQPANSERDVMEALVAAQIRRALR